MNIRFLSIGIAVMAGIILVECIEDNGTCPNDDGGGDGGPPSSWTVNYDTLTDIRDGKTYRTVTMPDGRIWMAENLNYEADDSWCYEDNSANCNTYGRLYTWVAAMAIDTIYYAREWVGNDLNHQGVCPDEWRIPSQYDWTELVNAVNSSTLSSNEGTRLKSRSGWRMNGNGTDDFGFSALPAGLRTAGGIFDHVGLHTYWWATRDGVGVTDGRAHARILYYNSDRLGGWITTSSWDFEHKRAATSVRCVRDEL